MIAVGLRRLLSALLVIAAGALIVAATAVIRLTPLRRIAVWFGEHLGAVDCAPLASARQLSRARRVRNAVAIAVRLVPGRSDCYPQALAAACLCRLLGVPVAVHFGVRTERSAPTASLRLAGHVWVVSGTVAVCGGFPAPGEFSTVACFLRPTD